MMAKTLAMDKKLEGERGKKFTTKNGFDLEEKVTTRCKMNRAKASRSPTFGTKHLLKLACEFRSPWDETKTASFINFSKI